MAWAKTGSLAVSPGSYSFGVTTRSLAAAGTALSSVLTEQLLGVTFTIPAGVLAAGDTLEVYAAGNLTQTTTAGNCTARARVGAVSSGTSGTIAAQALNALNNAAAGSRQFVIRAALTVRTIGATGTIIGTIYMDGPAFNLTAAAALAPITTAIAVDTTQARDITLTVQQSAANFTAGAAQVGYIRRAT